MFCQEFSEIFRTSNHSHKKRKERSFLSYGSYIWFRVWTFFRSHHSHLNLRISILRNFAGKYVDRSFFLIKLAGQLFYRTPLRECFWCTLSLWEPLIYFTCSNFFEVLFFILFDGRFFFFFFFFDAFFVFVFNVIWIEIIKSIQKCFCSYTFFW